jgi:hypothetical protein
MKSARIFKRGSVLETGVDWKPLTQIYFVATYDLFVSFASYYHPWSGSWSSDREYPSPGPEQSTLEQKPPDRFVGSPYCIANTKYPAFANGRRIRPEAPI